mgnify:CR=1 FL=1
MIISASRRTDIPTYYSDWFFNRIKEGYVMIRNPKNFHQVGKISLSPDVVDGIVFWTKNPIPMLNRLNELKNYHYYFQFTLNSYGQDIEPNVPSKNDVIIPAFKKLSKKIGKEKVIWRYDPILLNNKYTIEYHKNYFGILASKLCKYTEKCTISFVDMYYNAVRNMKQAEILALSFGQKIELMDYFSKVAEKYGLYIDTCAEDIDLSRFGIKHAHCIDKERFEQISKYNLVIEKDKNQRIECGCVSSIDIGTYNTCKNGCLYCYANYSKTTVNNNYTKHNPLSPMLYGEITDQDVIKIRSVKSCKECQAKLFNNNINVK